MGWKNGKEHAVTLSYMDPSYNTQMCEVEVVHHTYHHQLSLLFVEFDKPHYEYDNHLHNPVSTKKRKIKKLINRYTDMIANNINVICNIVGKFCNLGEDVTFEILFHII